MATPLDQLTAALREAIAGALADAGPEFANLLNGIPTGGGSSGGGTSEDLVSAILGIVGIGLALNPEIDITIEGLKELSGGLGGNGQSLGIAYFLAQTMIPLVEPYTRYIQHYIEAEALSQVFDPATAADLAARQIITSAFGQSETGGGGFDEPHWQNLLDAAYTRPPWDVALRLWNRGYIQETDVDTSLQYGGVPEFWWTPLKSLQQELLTPADWALAALRQNVTVDQAKAGAAAWGLSADDFNTLMLNTGEPLGLMQMLEAFRRDFIDQPTLERGIRESRVRDEWIQTAIDLRYAPMSTAAAANAVVRGYLSTADGQKIAEQNGLEPDHWQYVLESNGRPLSHEQMATLFYRGLVSKAEWEQAIRESDVKDKYIQDAVDLGVKLLPLFEGVTLLKNGDISGKTFSQQMLDQGYEKEVVTEIVAAFGTGKASSSKHLTVAEIVDMYEIGSVTEDQAEKRIMALGYTKDDSDAILNNAKVKAAAERQRTLITSVKTQFTHYQIDDVAATQELTEIGVDTTSAARLIRDWTIIRPKGSRNLTETQIIHLVKLGTFTQTEGVTRLQGLGFSESDAQILIGAYA